MNFDSTIHAAEVLYRIIRRALLRPQEAPGLPNTRVHHDLRIGEPHYNRHTNLWAITVSIHICTSVNNAPYQCTLLDEVTHSNRHIASALIACLIHMFCFYIMRDPTLLENFHIHAHL